jgi:hypothetical protein
VAAVGAGQQWWAAGAAGDVVCLQVFLTAPPPCSCVAMRRLPQTDVLMVAEWGGQCHVVKPGGDTLLLLRPGWREQAVGGVGVPVLLGRTPAGETAAAAATAATAMPGQLWCSWGQDAWCAGALGWGCACGDGGQGRCVLSLLLTGAPACMRGTLQEMIGPACLCRPGRCLIQPELGKCKWSRTLWPPVSVVCNAGSTGTWHMLLPITAWAAAACHLARRMLCLRCCARCLRPGLPQPTPPSPP